jgi:DNA polymerase elongation subunit (family B)
MIKLIMEGRPEAVGDLRNEFERKVRNREWTIEMLMKTDTLQDSLEKYRAKIAGSARNRAAAHELALASGRNYKPGDQISYITATPKKFRRTRLRNLLAISTRRTLTKAWIIMSPSSTNS